MSSFRNFILFAFVAVGVQVTLGFKLSIPTLCGGTVNLASIDSSNAIGGNVKLEDAGFTANINMGPAGSYQASLVTPLIPGIKNIVQSAQDNISKTANEWTSGLGQFGSWVSSNIDKNLALVGMKLPKFELWEEIVGNLKFDIDGVKTSITDRVSQVGGILQTAIDQEKLTLEEAGNVASAVLKSAIENTINPISKLMDLLKVALAEKIILETEAIQLLLKGINDGIHELENVADWSLETFLDGAANAGTITADMATKLKELIPSVNAKLAAEVTA